MGLFNNIFNSKPKEAQETSTPWIALENLSQLSAIAEASKSKTQLIFKHSTRCGISRMVKKQFENDYNITANQADLYYLDLLNHRDISNEIAARFSVHHESPQLLVIKNEKVSAHASHGSINDLDIVSFL
ncbi:MAG: bacillithiol system redox-active protein YtxJ [Flavobacteriaceae bacterium]